MTAGEKKSYTEEIYFLLAYEITTLAGEYWKTKSQISVRSPAKYCTLSSLLDVCTSQGRAGNEVFEENKIGKYKRKAISKAG